VSAWSCWFFTDENAAPVETETMSNSLLGAKTALGAEFTAATTPYGCFNA
jgi:hypothetical protein